MPGSDLELVGDTTFKGSLFARNLAGVGSLDLTAGGQRVATPENAPCQPGEVVVPAGVN